MFPISRINSKKLINNQVNNIKIINGKYIPKYENPRDLISENEIFEMFIF